MLAYSGGLDTSVIVPWLKENYHCEIVCYCGNVGQNDDMSDLQERALAAGASKLIIDDLQEEFAKDYNLPAWCAPVQFMNGNTCWVPASPAR